MAARLPDDLLARTPAEGARLVALAHVADAAEARSRLDDSADQEALHDFRVAVRRLRSTLVAYKHELAGSVPKQAARRLRRAARATNAGRDLEVQIAWLDVQRARMYSRQRPGALWLRARLAAAKQQADAEASGAVGRKVERALARLQRALPAYTVRARVALAGEMRATAPRFAGTLAARLREGTAVLGAGLHAAAAARTDHAAAPGDDATGAAAAAHRASEEAHDARLAAKRVRYLLAPIAKLVEGAGPVLAQLKVLQNQLGELHDLDVLAAVLERAKRDAADEAARAEAERAAATPAPTPNEAPDEAPHPTLAEVPDAASPAESGAAPPPAPDVRPGLVALARRAAARRTALDAEVGATWLAGAGAGLVAALDGLAAVVDAEHAGPAVEIERKYLLRALPRQLRGAERMEVDQGWLPGETLRERVRRVRDAQGERWVRTVKLGRGVSRIEVEEPCDRTLFDALWPLTRERRVQKHRYRVREGALVWEVDEFTDRALVLAEVELPAVDTEVALPSWLAPYLVREVTDEAEYVNANLARPAAGDG